MTFKPHVGRQRYCARACYELTNHEARLQRARAYYRKHRSDCARRMRDWYVAHRDEQLERAKVWKQTNPELRRLYNANRRARLRGAPLSLDDLAALPRVCAYCGRGDLDLTIDHRVPLSRGGHHEPSNLVWACAECNSRKRDRDELAFRALLALEAFVEARRRRRSIDEEAAVWEFTEAVA